jgi:plastocyanin
MYMKQLVAIIICTAALVVGLPSSAWAMPEFTLRIKEHKFTPAVLHIPANTKVRLIIKNLDATPEEFESEELHREKVIQGHGQGVVFIGPLAPGTYSFIGEFHEATARGQIVVK